MYEKDYTADELMNNVWNQEIKVDTEYIDFDDADMTDWLNV